MNDAVASPSPSSGAVTTGAAAPSFAKSADWSDPSSGSAPTGSSPGTEPPASATASPAPTTAPDGLPQQTEGPIPWDRHKAILEKAREEYVTKALTDYGLNGYAPEQLKAIAPWIQKASTDPDGFLLGELTSHADPVGLVRQALKQLQNDPRHAGTLRSLVGQAMQQLRGPGQAPQAPPMVKVQLEDGSVVDMPRDPGAWLQYHQQAWLKQLDDKFAPVTQTVTQLREQQQAAERQLQVDHFVTTTHQDVLTWPGMADTANQRAVAAELAQARIDANDPREVALAVNAAWRKVVAPTLSSNAERALLDKLKTNAAAATGVNPGSAAPSASRPVTKFSDLGPEAWR